MMTIACRYVGIWINWFLISVIGCPLPETPFNSYIQGDGDHIVVRCNYTTEAWHLTCRKGSWIGDVGNCSLGTDMAFRLFTVVKLEIRKGYFRPKQSEKSSQFITSQLISIHYISQL